MKKNIVLILTGTVDPGSMIYTRLKDPIIRRTHYINSIRWWIHNSQLPIIFIENSNTDLSADLQPEIDTGRLEMIHFEGNRFPASRGKGYGELNCLARVLACSAYVKEADFIFKITGRLTILNFQDFIDDFQKNQEVGLIIDLRTSLTFSDSRFFGCRPAFISDFLLPNQHLANDSAHMYMEHILAKAALQAVAAGYLFRPFICYPKVKGLSGSMGSIYDEDEESWQRKNRQFRNKFRSITGKSP